MLNRCSVVWTFLIAVACLFASAADTDAGALRRRAAASCEPCVLYRDCSCIAPCERTVKTALCVHDPCCCQDVMVPVCLPACCCGEPEVCCRHGLFGRYIVRYDWCCGCSVQVVFRACGDVVVTYL